jgi:hypothetical protein
MHRIESKGTTLPAPGASESGRKYVQIGIYDRENAAGVCDSLGPGSDIDAVALVRNGVVIGHGLKGSATYLPSAVPTCLRCGPMGSSVCEYADPRLVGNAEGPPDGEIHQTESDTGYFSLNGGVLGITIGDLAGEGPALSILPGDVIGVYEVDRTYDKGATPERYEVWLTTSPGSGDGMVQLLPAAFDSMNEAQCGSAPAPGATLGCGTSVFVVP